MEKGKNSDLTVNGSSYHVQTEDWGVQNPYLVSHIFQRGAVLKTIKIPYTKVLPDECLRDPESIQVALETQHQTILDLLVSGQLSK